MVVPARSLVDSCDTGVQGQVLRQALLNALRDDACVAVDFSGITNVTFSFVNAAFVVLLLDMSFDDIRRRVKIVNAHRQIANMVRQRVTVESQRMLAAA